VKDRLGQGLLIMVNVFNVSAFFIVLREVLEACLVVGIVIAYLHKTGSTHLCKWVWIGAAAGVLLSGIIGIALTVVYYTKGVAKFTGKTEQYFEAVMFTIAAALLTWMIMWMLKMGKSLRGKIEANLDKSLDQDSRKAKVGIASLIFVQCFREGIETFVFLFGVQESTSGTEVDTSFWKGIILPGLLGVVVAVAIAYFVFRGLLSFDIQYILFLSSIILMFFAAGLTTRAFHELQETQALGAYEDDNRESTWWNAAMWSTKACCNSSSNEFFATLKALFGYSHSPTFVHVVGYVGFWLIVLPLLAWFYWETISSARNKIANYARGMAGIAVICFLIGFIYAVSHPTWTGILTTGLGLLFSTVACLALFDMLVNKVAAIKTRRKAILLATSTLFGLLAILGTILPIVQMSCLDKACRLPKFYYWGLILNQSWLDTADTPTKTAFKAVAVLTVSICITLVFLGGITFVLYLFAKNVGADGNYVYEDMHHLDMDDSVGHAPNQLTADTMA
jgi:high-affinity iron transporter